MSWSMITAGSLQDVRRRVSQDSTLPTSVQEAIITTLQFSLPENKQIFLKTEGHLNEQEKQTPRGREKTGIVEYGHVDIHMQIIEKLSIVEKL